MKLARYSTVLAGIMTLAATLPASDSRADLVLPRPSPAATSKQTIGTTDLTLAYSRPGVKGRPIWGTLVPYDKPWRTGANEPTSLVTTGEVNIGGKKLAAGSYTVFTVPTAKEWKLAVSTQKNLLQDTTPFDPKQVVLEVTATPETSQPNQEWLWMGFDDLTPQGANLVMRWEKLKLAVPVTVDVNTVVLAHVRTEVAAAKADDWQTRSRAAAWALDNDVAKTEAAGWLDQSLAIKKTHGNLALRARWLMKDGKKAEAITTAKEAIAAGKAATPAADTAPTEKLVADWMATK